MINTEIESTPSILAMDGLPGIERVTYFLGSYPIRMAVLLTLDTFPEDHYATRGVLTERFQALQGEKPGWQCGDDMNLVYNHCKMWLSEAGLVEFGAIKNAQGRPANGVRLSKRGRALLCVAGALFCARV